ncbi:general secretion pathway protein GspD [Synechococcus sp. MU1650]|uniref:general secretion pathway protein GspD n=1 Tax=Synechococcus sp. MU1650 TaxID=2508352 RepID=UPI001CF8454C
MRSFVVRRILPLAIALGIGTPSTELFALVAAPQAVARSPVALRLRQSGNRVDLIVTGVGEDTRVIGKSLSPHRWQGRFQVASTLSLSAPQEATLSSAGLRSVRLSQNNASELELVVTTLSEGLLSRPQISANGKDLIVTFVGLRGVEQASTTGQLDLRQPGRVAQSSFVPPMRERASAPPLGDIAVGTMLVNQKSLIAASGPPVTLALNNAPAKNALMSLARLGGLGFVYVNPRASSEDQNNQDQDSTRLVSLAFKDEPFGRALNSVLLASGLQAKLEGRTLLVGETLESSGLGPQMSKVFRLNQAKTDTAANYLSSLGAQMSKVRQIEVTRGEAASADTSELSAQVSQTKQFLSEVETIAAQKGPLLGLVGTTDGRLGTVTLVGESRLIALAESYLRQIDLRQRQVAIKVQIISVKLDNEKTLESSFSSRMGNTFIVSDSGKGHLNFGDYKPGGSDGTGLYGEGVSGVPGTYPLSGKVPRQRVIDPTLQKQVVAPFVAPNSEQIFVPVDPDDPVYAYDSQGRPIYVPDTNPGSPQVLHPVYDKKGRPKYVSSADQYRQPSNSFYSYLEAKIQSRSAKILAQPTLLVGEGQTSATKTGLEVVTNIVRNVERDEDGTVTDVSTTYQKETAGLTLTVGVDKIDDNGFVSMSVLPRLGFPVSAGERDGIPFFNIDARELVAKGIRLRDQQTLIVSGVMSERQTESVTKWPILGDLPLIGSLFRGSSSTRTKEELVIVVTPYILNDDQGGAYGYGYVPGTQQVRTVLGAGYR